MTNIRNALMQAAGTAASGDPVYVEDVFSNYLYTTDNAARTIVNGIDLAGEGGLMWFKSRTDTQSHALVDSTRGNNVIYSNKTNAQDPLTVGGGGAGSITLNNNGFSFSGSLYSGQSNINYGTTTDVVSWTFRKQKGFFDVVKFSTTGGGGTQAISHNLGSIPGFIMIKKTSAAQSWFTFHKSVTSPNSNWWRNWSDMDGAAFDDYFSDDSVINGAPTATTVTLGTTFTNGTADYVAYFFAEGGTGDQIFGDDGDEAIIKCGSYSSATEINLGFEPQWLMAKRTSGSGNWFMLNNMTGFFGSTALTNRLMADVNAVEGSDTIASVTSTGFNSYLFDGAGDYLYIAIRRGPMKEPSAGTDVFTPVRPSASGTFTAVSGFPTDLTINKGPNSGDTTYLGNRLTGVNSHNPTSTALPFSVNFAFDFMNQITIGGTGDYSAWISWNFRRYPKVHDAVNYIGAGAGTHAHNLTAVPELMIIKCTSHTNRWIVYSAALGNTKQLHLDEDIAETTGQFNDTTPTASVFSVSDNTQSGTSGRTYMALLFSTLAGISKCGSYTGTAADLNVDCGFSGGARFVMIKRSDSTGDWYVFDTVTGIVDGNEAYNLLNTTTGVQAAADYIDPLASGFTVTSSAPAALNASGGTYLFLAFA